VASSTSVTTRPGVAGVPRWSVLPWLKARRQPRKHTGAALLTASKPQHHTRLP
jgi:hypothetical protein